MKNGKTIYHIEFKEDIGRPVKHKYYTNLKKLCEDNDNLGVSWWTLVRLKTKDFPFENGVCHIRKGVLIATKFKNK